MSFASSIGGCPIIDDHNAHEFVEPVVDGHRVARGMMPRDYHKVPYGSLENAEPLSLPLIPESEWAERIKDREKLGARVQDLCDAAGLKVKNQEQTPYCWINAPTHCVEVARVAAGLPYVELSPASAGAKIKNFQAVGGWGTEGVEFIAKSGLVPASIWPNNAINKKYDTPAADAERPKYQIDEWWELKPRSFEELMSCLLLGIPVAIGLNWWGHEVTAIDGVVLKGGAFGVMIDNSWGTSWGQNGRGVLARSKATPDDAIAPRVVTA